MSDFNMKRRLIIGVMGSAADTHESMARPLGKLIAEKGYHLLTGGGLGVMAEVSRAFCEVRNRMGLSIGIIRSERAPTLEEGSGKRRYIPHPVEKSIEIPIFTHLPLTGANGTEFLSRNHINVLTSDVLIALPGGSGTYSEVKLRLEYGRPVILFLGEGAIDGRKTDHFRDDPRYSRYVLTAGSIEEVPRRIRESLGFPVISPDDTRRVD